MQKTILAILIAIFSWQLHAQSDLVFFSSKGEVFYVYLNGIQQNKEPGSIISIQNVPAPNYKLKIRFHYEKQSPPIEKEIFFTPGKEINYIIKQNKEGNFVLRFYSEVPRLGFEDTLLNHRILDYTKTPMKERKYNIQSDTNRKK